MKRALEYPHLGCAAKNQISLNTQIPICSGNPDACAKRVSFFLPHDEWPAALTEMDPDRDHHLFRTGQRIWILQTYMRLARAGRPVSLTDRVPGGGVVIFYAAHKRQVCALRETPAHTLLVGVRGDRHEIDTCDVEILQNPAFTFPPRRLMLQHWPQAGLLPRDPARGTSISEAGFKGASRNLHRELSGEPWRRQLAQLGIQWQHDPHCDSAEQPEMEGNWHDYSTMDLLIAIRPPDAQLHPSKPATKLYNAWSSGVPAILGPETAYRSLRQSDLDYLEASDAREALAAVEWLKRNPGRYRAMVERGRKRAAEFSHSAILRQWDTLLFEQLLPELPRYRRRTPLWSRRVLGSLDRFLRRRPRR